MLLVHSPWVAQYRPAIITTCCSAVKYSEEWLPMFVLFVCRLLLIKSKLTVELPNPFGPRTSGISLDRLLQILLLTPYTTTQSITPRLMWTFGPWELCLIALLISSSDSPFYKGSHDTEESTRQIGETIGGISNGRITTIIFIKKKNELINSMVTYAIDRHRMHFLSFSQSSVSTSNAPNKITVYTIICICVKFN